MVHRGHFRLPVAETAESAGHGLGQRAFADELRQWVRTLFQLGNQSERQTRFFFQFQQVKTTAGSKSTVTPSIVTCKPSAVLFGGSNLQADMDMQHCADGTYDGKSEQRTPPEFLLLPCTGALARAKMVCPSAPFPWALAGASSPVSPDDHLFHLFHLTTRQKETSSADAIVALGRGATADGPSTLSLLDHCLHRLRLHIDHDAINCDIFRFDVAHRHCRTAESRCLPGCRKCPPTAASPAHQRFAGWCQLTHRSHQDSG